MGATVPIYCDECGALEECEHRCSVCWRPVKWCRCEKDEDYPAVPYIPYTEEDP